MQKALSGGGCVPTGIPTTLSCPCLENCPCCGFQSSSSSSCGLLTIPLKEQQVPIQSDNSTIIPIISNTQQETSVGQIIFPAAALNATNDTSMNVAPTNVSQLNGNALTALQTKQVVSSMISLTLDVHDSSRFLHPVEIQLLVPLLNESDRVNLCFLSETFDRWIIEDDNVTRDVVSDFAIRLTGKTFHFTNFAFLLDADSGDDRDGEEDDDKDVKGDGDGDGEVVGVIVGVTLGLVAFAIILLALLGVAVWIVRKKTASKRQSSVTF